MGRKTSSSSLSSADSPGRPRLSSTIRQPPSPTSSSTYTSTSSAAAPDLLAAVRSGASLQQAAADLLETYQGPAATAALAALLQLLVSAAGSSAVVTPEMLEELEVEELVARVAAEEHMQAAAQGAEARKLRASMGELLGHLVAVTSNSALYDGRLIDLLVGLATSMSGCATRTVRHAGTLAAMEVMTALVGVARREGERQANAARQLEAEGRKAAKNRAADRLEVLRAMVAEARENTEELGQIMEHLYTSVFVLRCKDVAVEVRALCLEHLGGWVAELPGRFLEDSRLKYLGWFLNDPEPQVVTHDAEEFTEQRIRILSEEGDFRQTKFVFSLKL